MSYDVCPICSKKQFNKDTGKCYNCKIQRRPDKSFVKVPDGYFMDQAGNFESHHTIENKDGKKYISYHYLLEPGATTLRSLYPKLSSKCPYSDRLACDDGYYRCEYMKYVDGRWQCIK